MNEEEINIKEKEIEELKQQTERMSSELNITSKEK
tara:strand:+ start:60 stop:164 length:105 start_codon:yes stop_codon:yes gene_type:complete